MIALNQKALAIDVDLSLLQPEYIPELSCEKFKFYGVDGKYLRDVIHLNYTQGGNGYRYPWINKGEGWLDKDNRREWLFIAIHELHEVNYAVSHWLNLLDSHDYDIAHEEADKVEQVARDNPELAMDLLRKEWAEWMDTESFKSNTTGDLRVDLAQSMLDEAQAGSDYRKRAQICLIQGDTETAELYEHIAAEEDNHFEEFKERYKKLWTNMQ